MLIYMKSIYIIGYYNHNNIGDEQYKLSINYILNKYKNDYNIEFIDCDNINNIIIKGDDIIILGGGDILNNYFMDQINKKFINKENTIIALSVGIPYNDIIFTTKLDIIDYLFLRTQQDMELFSHYFTSDRLYYIPDLSIYLNNIFNDDNNNIDIEKINEIQIYNKTKCTFFQYNENDNIIISTRNKKYNLNEKKKIYQYDNNYYNHENKLLQIQKEGYIIIAF